MKIFPFVILFSALSILALSLPGCREATREPLTGANGEPVVFASIPPLAGLIERVAGGEVEVRSLVSDTQDPHDFSPTPKQLVALSGAAAFFTTGMPFEETLVEKLADSARGLEIVDVTEGIEMHEFAAEADDDHNHEHDHEHDHDHDHDHGGETDPHIWLSPPLLQQQLGTIVEALKAVSPDHAAEFEERGSALDAEIAALHEELSEKLEPLKGQRFYVYHGAFAYFAEAYGLVQESIETGGRKPEQKRIVSLIESARKDGVKTIFVQPQFDPDSARTIADQIGGEVLAVDPMDRDFLTNLRKIADAISSGR